MDETSISLAVHTVRRDGPDEQADYELDWRAYFEGQTEPKGPAPLDEPVWNELMLPELRELHTRIRAETSARVLRLRGLARLSPWMAVGYEFRESAGWTIETDQYGQLWRTDARPSSAAPSITPIERPGSPATVAVALSITGHALPHVVDHLAAEDDPAGRLLHIATPHLGRDAIGGAGDLVAFARGTKRAIQALRPRAARLLVYYWGPSSGAVFIGHQLNATASEIQLFEDQSGTYVPSFTLG